nr:LLM class flavin-dependent oxidoreductase [Yimella sp. NH-Cas1]
MIPFVPRRPAQALPFAGLAQWTGTDRVWQGQGLLTEGHSMFSHFAGAGFGLDTGFGVSLMPFQHPYEAALRARSLALTTGRSVVAGFGPGGRQLQEALLGSAYRSPLTAAREYLSIVRDLLAGRIAELDGDYFTVRAQLEPVPTPAIETGLGVLRPKMARVAGEVADCAITWLTPAQYLTDTIVPALHDGARAAGRDAAPRLVSIVPVALQMPKRDPRAVALASNRAHLSLPHYQDMLRGAGLHISGDPEKDVDQLIEHGAFVHGDLDTITDRILQLHKAGVDEIVLNLSGVNGTEGPQASARELATLIGHLTQEIAA